MTTEQKTFIGTLAKYVEKYAPRYGILVRSSIIAQGILESGWGKSKLAAKYHNYFGLKTGSKWTGKAVNMATQEEYTPGTLTDITDSFRVYDNMEEGVKGYFEFIQLSRYQNLRGITDPENYLRTIWEDGYSTASNYVSDAMEIIRIYGLTVYDPVPTQVTKVEEKDVVLYGHGSGTPRKTDLRTYTNERYAKTAPNGKHKGVAAVRRFKALTDAGRAKFEERFRTILGRNKYSQDLRGYVYTKYKDGKYYSDCSSSGMATLKVIGYKVGDYLLNTAGIYYEDDYFEDVPVRIQNGHITNPEILKVGDAVLYIGNDPSRPLQIGHVEWVAAMPVSPQDAQGATNTEAPVKNTGKTEKPLAGYSGAFPEIPSRGYYTLGDGYKQNPGLITDVKKLQRLINWINGGNINVDGCYGPNTAAAVKMAQTTLRVTADGLFGPKTLMAAKAYKK